MADIFLSYNHDDRAVARRFAEALEAQGFDVWWDVTVRSGEAYDEITEVALRAAKAVVVLWSKKSVASRWVRAEAALANRLGKLAPVTIERCERPVMFELIQTADLSAWRGNVADRAWLAFLADARRMVAGEQDNPTPVQIAKGATFKLPNKPSIAVLPFTDMAGEGGQDHFADGVVEEISTALSRFQTLFVIAGASSLSYRGAEQDPARICRELGVRYLLEGSVRKAGGKVRITAKLIDGIEGEQIWADRFEDSLEDIFKLQDRVAGAVAGLIDSAIDTAEIRRAVTRPIASPDAMELYWRANAVFRKFDRESLTEAVSLAEQVLQLEPDNAWAASLAGFCHASRFAFGWTDDAPASRAAAFAEYDRAMRDGGDDARVLGYCSAILVCAGGDGAAATRLIDRTLALNPGSATGLLWGGWNDVINGQPVRGLERLEASLRLNPRAVVRPLLVAGMGICLFELRRFDEAATVLGEAVQRLPHFPPALACLAAALAHGGKLAEAKTMALRLMAVSGGAPAPALLRDPGDLQLLGAGIALALGQGEEAKGSEDSLIRDRQNAVKGGSP